MRGRALPRKALQRTRSFPFEGDSLALLYVYTMTHDTGFAPHVDRSGRFLTLATCKPKIRAVAKLGDWIMGIAGVARLDGSRRGRVVYLAEVTRDPSTFSDYFSAAEFQGRLDNIYWRNGSFHQVKNPFHGPEQVDHDTSADSVLISERFVYFGRQGPSLGDSGFADLVWFAPGHTKWTIEPDSVADSMIRDATVRWRGWNRWLPPSEDDTRGCDESCGSGEEG